MSIKVRKRKIRGKKKEVKRKKWGVKRPFFVKTIYLMQNKTVCLLKNIRRK